MNFHRMLKHTEKVITDNSPTILTAIGVAGTVATAYFTGRASFKAAEILREESIKKAPGNQFSTELEPKEKVQLTWRLFIPAFGTGTLTVVAIICANRVGMRRAAAMAAAYTISERAFYEYRDKVIEKIGEKPEQKIRDEIAQDRVNRFDQREIVMVTESGKVMCHDQFSNQFFWSDMESLRRAENDINRQILHSDSATVSDFYTYVGADGLEETSVSGDLGWNTDKMLELEFSTVMHKEKTPCISIRFATVPVADPWRFR